jgi:hypothetical protein
MTSRIDVLRSAGATVSNRPIKSFYNREAWLRGRREEGRRPVGCASKHGLALSYQMISRQKPLTLGRTGDLGSSVGCVLAQILQALSRYGDVLVYVVPNCPSLRIPS